MPLVGRAIRLEPNPDGTLDGGFPNGDKNPAVTALSWDLVGLAVFAALVASRTVGSGAFSSNVRTYLMGTNAATAVLSVLSVSGTDAAANGWGASGNNVTNAGSNAGAGFFKIGANDGTGTVYCNPLAWSWIASATDTLAPCVPTGGAVSVGAGTVTFACDIPGDAHNGTIPGAMATVQLRIASSTVEEKTVSAGLSPSTTLLNFGGSTPSPSFVQTGNSWALSGGGAGTQGTTESFPFRYAQVSGDFRLTCKLTSFTSAADVFSSCGLMIRENITGLDRYVAFYSQQSDGTLQFKARVTQGGSANNQLTSSTTVALPAWLQIERAGGTIYARYSLDGGTWIEFFSMPFALGATAFAGFFICSKVNGTSVSAVMDQIWFSNQGRVTFTPISTAVAKTAKFRAKDAAGTPNLSAESVAITGTPIVTAYKKWNPGHGIRTNQATVSASNLSALAAQSEYLYCDMECRWKDVAPTLNARDYTLLDNHVAACVARGKKAILQVSYKVFNTSNSALLMPSDYLHSTAASGGFIANIWESDKMDEYIKLMLDVIARYDGNSAVEMFIFPESSSSLGNPLPASFTRPGYATQLKRMYAALAAAAVHTTLCGQINYTGGEIAGLIRSLYQNGWAMGDTDAKSTTANVIFNGGATDDGSAPFDYRGKMPRMTMASTPSLSVGSSYYNGPPPNIIDYMQTGATTHGLWVLSRVSPNSPTDILAAINADPTLSTSCPAIYGGTCVP